MERLPIEARITHNIVDLRAVIVFKFELMVTFFSLIILLIVVVDIRCITTEINKYLKNKK